MSARIEIGPIEVLALKELSLVVRALATTIKEPRANRTLTQMLHVLVDVAGRADFANTTAPDEAIFKARVEALVREQSDPAWAARLVWEYVSGSKA